MSYTEIMNKRKQIIRDSTRFDYERFELGGLAFAYEAMMQNTGYSHEEIRQIQHSTGVGNTPLLELHNITRLARRVSQIGRASCREIV